MISQLRFSLYRADTELTESEGFRDPRVRFIIACRSVKMLDDQESLKFVFGFRTSSSHASLSSRTAEFSRAWLRALFSLQ